VVILNQIAAQQLGVSPEEMVGITLRLGEDESTVVIGVVEDFHFEPLQSPIIPLVLIPRWADQYLAIGLVGAPTPTRLAAVHAQWAKVLPDFPLNYTLLSDTVHRAMAKERTMTDLLMASGVVILAIVLVGVFAMTSYASRHRAKEIAVRRVLGATLFVQALSVIVWPYLRLAAIATALATPPAIILCLRWLDAYPDRNLRNGGAHRGRRGGMRNPGRHGVGVGYAGFGMDTTGGDRDATTGVIAVIINRCVLHGTVSAAASVDPEGHFAEVGGRSCRRASDTATRGRCRPRWGGNRQRAG
jgi:hypothetical protein